MDCRFRRVAAGGLKKRNRGRIQGEMSIEGWLLGAEGGGSKKPGNILIPYLIDWPGLIRLDRQSTTQSDKPRHAIVLLLL